MVFNFEIFEPIVISDADSLSIVLNDLYDVDVYPLQIITDKTHSVFQDINLPHNIKPKIIILPIRYLIKFLA